MPRVLSICREQGSYKCHNMRITITSLVVSVAVYNSTIVELFQCWLLSSGKSEQG